MPFASRNKQRKLRPALAFEKLEDRSLMAAVMVSDINTKPADSLPSNLIAVGQSLFFTATEQSSTTPSLWKSDGSAVGTIKVKDVSGGLSQAAVGNTLYFTSSVNN